MMNTLITVLRLAHILLGVVWVGFGAVSAWVLHPAAERLGSRGDDMLRTFYAYSNFNKVMPVAAGGTTLAGVVLWALQANSLFDLANFAGLGDIVMVIGAVFGLLAFGHGASATGRFSGMYAQAAVAYDDNPTPETEQALKDGRAKLFTHSNISAWLALVAVVCMSGARYLA